MTEEQLKIENEKLTGRLTAIEDMQKSLAEGIKALGQKEEQVVQEQLVLQKQKMDWEAQKTAEAQEKEQKEKEETDRIALEQKEAEKPTQEKIHVITLKYVGGHEITLDERKDKLVMAEMNDEYFQTLYPKATLIEVIYAVRYQTIANDK